MWRELANRVSSKKPSSSTEDMALLLYALTVGTQDAEGERSLAEEIEMVSTEGLKTDVAQIELALLKFSVVYIALFRYDDLRRLHGPRLDQLQRRYVTHFKERLQQTGPAYEEAFLQISESRLAAYNKAFDAWREAHDKGRGHEQAFAIGEIFFNFCGVVNHNPARLSFIQHKFFRTIAAVNKRLRICKLT